MCVAGVVRTVPRNHCARLSSSSSRSLVEADLLPVRVVIAPSPQHHLALGHYQVPPSPPPPPGGHGVTICKLSVMAMYHNVMYTIMQCNAQCNVMHRNAM